MISCNHLTIGYGTRVIQRDLSFTIADGELVALLGANGCGKSTLLRTLAGLQQPLGGECRFSFSEAFQQRSDLAARRSKYIALVLTERLSVDSATVRDVVAMGRYPYTSFLGTLTAADSRIVNEAMQQVDVLDLADTFYNDHSDGEKQRILIAKALAQQTPVILLDEPTAHLDLPSRIKTLNLLRSIAHEQNDSHLYPRTRSRSPYSRPRAAYVHEERRHSYRHTAESDSHRCVYQSVWHGNSCGVGLIAKNFFHK